MSCINNLFNFLSGNPGTGGKWYYMGMYFEPLSPTYQDIGDQGSGLYAMSTNDPLTGGTPLGQRLVGSAVIHPENITFDSFLPSLPNLNSDGVFFAYEYVQGERDCGDETCSTYGDWAGYCSIARVVVQVLPQPCAGDDRSYTLCDDNVTNYELRTELGEFAPCSILPAQSIEGETLSVITYANGDPLSDGVDGITISNPGTPSETIQFRADQAGPGTYSFKNTVSIINNFDVECPACDDYLEATITFNVSPYSNPGTLNPLYDPYAVVCDDPDCTLDFSDLYSGDVTTGTWKYMGEYAGGATNGNDEPIFTGCDCSNPPTASCSFRYGVDQTTTPGQSVAYYYACPGDILNSSATGEYYFDQTNLDITYTFKYEVGIGTPCPFTRWAFVRLENAADAGTEPADYNGCIKDFAGVGYNQSTDIYDLWAALGNPSNQDGDWTVTLVEADGGFAGGAPTVTDINNWYDDTNQTFDFNEFRERYDVQMVLEFSYTSTVSGNTVCPICAGSDTSTWTLKLGSGCDIVSTTASDNSPYTSVPYTYPGGNMNFVDVMTEAGYEGCSHWRFRFQASRTYSGGTSEAVCTDLQVKPVGTPDNQFYTQTKTAGSSLVYQSGGFVLAEEDSIWNFDQVPPGVYCFEIASGSSGSIGGDFIDCDITQFYVFIEVEACFGCNQIVTLIY
jgi:hypothetical protein